VSPTNQQRSTDEGHSGGGKCEANGNIHGRGRELKGHWGFPGGGGTRKTSVGGLTIRVFSQAPCTQSFGRQLSIRAIGLSRSRRKRDQETTASKNSKGGGHCRGEGGLTRP